MAQRLRTAGGGFAAAFERLLAAKRENAEDVDEAVANIIAEVRARGDAAVLDATRRFDRLDVAAVAALRIRPERIEAARGEVDERTRAALELAAERIRAYHERQRPADCRFTDGAGAELGWRWTPLPSVGLYVPGGTAAYPSSVLMNAIPAKVAGVARVAMAVPAPAGALSPAVLAAAALAGVDEIWTIGGAQAVAALAYGTATIAPVAKIVGPGNAYVAAAKRRVFGEVGIDMIAGPSEVLVIADRTADPAFVAADLIAQAEHDEAAQSILITDDVALADAVAREVEAQLASLPRAAIASASWRAHGALILVGELDEAVALADRLAPEHLELIGPRAEALVDRISHAGAIFLGEATPEAVGDYVAGSNHVLPTARSARFSSGLGVLDFMKRTSILRVPPAALAVIGPAAVALGEAEALHGHARSVAMRLARLPRA
jgi:histidinol dehydrogenase